MQVNSKDYNYDSVHHSLWAAKYFCQNLGHFHNEGGNLSVLPWGMAYRLKLGHIFWHTPFIC